MGLLQRVEKRQAKIAVIGLGYVGLPLAVAFAKAGFHVLGIDIDKKKIEALQAGKSYIADVSQEDVGEQVQRGTLIPSDDYVGLEQADVVVICVPTPLGKTQDPDVSYILAVGESIKKYLKPGSLIVLESTTYPGFTREVFFPMLQKSGTDEFYLAFSPERIDPANRTFTLRNTPKVVGGVSKEATEAAAALYKAVTERVVTVSSADAAEMVKLLENTFRAVNIALANEFAVICDRLKLDVWEVIEGAANKPFGFMPFYPGPGLGGHCIPIDPRYLAWRMQSLNYRTRLIELALEINSSMPRYVVEKVMLALNEENRPLKGAEILVLGVAYKADVSDTRESPAKTIIALLEDYGANVSFYDPYVSRLEVEGRVIDGLSSLSDHDLERANCVLIVTGHSTLDYGRVVSRARLVVDTRNATKGVRGKARIVRL
jgi:UDP-N-acetyl-D-glucosamine dehydrogenase